MMMIPVSSIGIVSAAKSINRKDKEVIKHIVDILRENPYSEHLRTMAHVENLDDYRIALNLDQTLNRKTYNTPLTSERTYRIIEKHMVL
jgi:hypothetical protein